MLILTPNYSFDLLEIIYLICKIEYFQNINNLCFFLCDFPFYVFDHLFREVYYSGFLVTNGRNFQLALEDAT